MKKKLTIIISIILSLALIQCSGNFFDEYEKGRYVDENPPSPDTTAPEIAKVEAVDAYTVQVEFSEELDQESSETINNYHIQGLNRIEIMNASLNPDGKTVSLSIAVQPRERRMKHGMEYTILVQNVKDTYDNAITYRTSNFTGFGWVIAGLSSTPPEITNSTGINIEVSGSGIVAYQYMLDDGAWSEEFIISDDPSIVLTGLDEGYHTLKVVGKKADGEWQEINYATVFGWEIDITPPTARLLNTPDNITDKTYIDVYVSAPDIVAYKYMIENDTYPLAGEYSEALPISNVISLSGLEPGDYTLSVLAIDSAGNEQETPTVHTWRIIDSNEIAAVLSGLPPKITKTDTAEITVGGQRVMYYKYSLNGSGWTELTGINNLLYLENLAEQEHVLEVIGADQGGITQTEPTTYSWTIDNTAPVAILSNLPPSLSSSQMIHVIVSGDEVEKYRYKIDSGQWSGLITSSIDIDITGITEGQHTLYVSGVDSVGNEQKDDYTLPPAQRTTSHTWTIDITPPVAALGNTPDALNNDLNLDVAVSGSSVVAYKYKLDEGSWSGETPVSSNITATLTEGAHLLSVIGRDLAGNWQNIYSPTTCSWVSDVTAPTAVLTNTPNNPTPDADINVQVSVGETNAGFKYRLDTGSWEPDGDPETYPDSYYTTPGYIDIEGLADGSHTLEVIARDEIGNWQSAPTTHTWVIDPNTPIVTLSNTPENPTKSTSESITVDPTHGAVTFDSYKYSLDYASPWTGEVSPIDINDPIDLTGLSDGVHVLQVRGYSFAEGWQTVANTTKITWRVDTVAPVAVLSNLPNDPTSSQSTGNITVQGIGAVGYKYRYDAGTWLPNAVMDNDPGNCITLATAINLTLANGDHDLYVIVKDQAGNWQSVDQPLDPPTEYSWTIDTSLVEADLENVPGEDNGGLTTSKTADITVIPSSYACYKYRYTLDGNFDGIFNSNPCSYEIWSAERPMYEHIILNFNVTGVTTVELEVIAKDIDNNWQQEANATSRTWTINTTEPVAELQNPPASLININELILAVKQDTDPAVASYKFRLDNGAWQDDGLIDGYPVGESIELGTPEPLSEGYHSLEILGRSEAGMWQSIENVSKYDWIVDTTRPIIDVIGLPPATTTNTELALKVGGSGVSTYKYIIDPPDSWSENWWGDPATGTDKDILIEETLTPGTYAIYIVGIDDALNLSDTMSSTPFHTWEIIDISVPTVTDAVYDYDTLLRFEWANPPGTDNVRIQVSTMGDNETNFENNRVDDGDANGVEIGAAEFYNFIADPVDGNHFFARVSIHNTEGWTEWGDISDGVYLVGSISGKVVDQSNNAIDGAGIELRYMDNTPVTGYTTSTNSEGNFYLPDVPSGDNAYKIVAGNDPYAAKNNITVVTGENTDIGLLYLVLAGTTGYISGTIVDANDGSSIEGAHIDVISWNNAVIDSDDSASDGTFSTTAGGLTAGTYSIIVSKSYPPKDYYDLTVDNIIITTGESDIERQALCEVLVEPQVRVIVLWGSPPTDLDLHLVGPTNYPGMDRFHIGYNGGYSQWSYNEATGEYFYRPGDDEGTFSTSSIVLDDTTSYGPEAINIFRLGATQYALGIFTYTIYNFANTSWGDDPITMRIYDSLGMAREVNFPSSGYSLSERYWKAIKINVQGIGRSKRKIYVVNGFGNLNYASDTSMDW